MRIGVNTLFLLPGEVGGSETYLREVLAQMVVRFPSEQFLLFTNVENDAALRADLGDRPNVRFEPLGFRATSRYRRIPREQLQLPGRVSRAGIDVLWSPGYVAPVRLPCPGVVSILDMQYKNHPEDLTLPARWAMRCLVWGAARTSRRIIALSEFSKGEIIRYLGEAPERITVTHLAVSDAYRAVPAVAERDQRVDRLIGGTGPYILSVANSYPHKNVDQVVEAYARLAANYPHRLVLVGQPRLGERRVQAALARVPGPDRVRRLMGVGAEDLVALYQGADLFVTASAYEGFGLPVLEAMAAGVPVVAGRAGAILEIGGDVPLYVPAFHVESLTAGLREALEWSSAEKTRRGAAGRARAATFTWDRTADATMACLRSAVCEGVGFRT